MRRKTECWLLLVIALSMFGCNRGSVPPPPSTGGQTVLDSRTAATNEIEASFSSGFRGDAPARYAHASTTFQQAYLSARTVAEHGGDAHAWFALGVAAAAVGRDGEAERAYRHALELKPDYGEAHCNLADVLERQEKWAEAIRHYRECVRLLPNLASGYGGLGDVYRKNGQWHQAVEYYRQALDRDKNDSISLRYLTLCDRAAGEAKKGVVRAETLADLGRVEPVARDDMFRGILPPSSMRGVMEPPSPPRMALRVPFRRDRWAVGDLTEIARAQLNEAASALRTETWHGKRVAILGYTCSCGSVAYNMDLARKRAEAVRDYLIARGALPAGSVIVIPRGKADPVEDTGDESISAARCETDERHTANRRVMIREANAADDLGAQRPNSESPTVAPTAAGVAFFWRPAQTGNFRPLRDGAILHSGDQIAVRLRASNPCYAYVVHCSCPTVGAKKLYRIFPGTRYQRDSTVSNPLVPGRDLWIPGPGVGLPLDEEVGEEETIVYIGATPEADLEVGPRSASDTEHTAPTPPNVREEVIIGMQMRGLGGVTASGSETELPANWFARVRFRHVR